MLQPNNRSIGDYSRLHVRSGPAICIRFLIILLAPIVFATACETNYVPPAKRTPDLLLRHYADVAFNASGGNRLQRFVGSATVHIESDGSDRATQYQQHLENQLRLVESLIGVKSALSANITETPATFGISVGRWR